MTGAFDLRDEAILTLAEGDDLHKLEAVIDRGLQSFIEVGEALREIRDSRLYRESHSTFEDYCRERWGFGERRGRQLIQAAEVAGMLPMGDTPQTESQARELVPLKENPEAMIAVLEEAGADGARTAAKIKQAVRRRRTEAEKDGLI